MLIPPNVKCLARTGAAGAALHHRVFTKLAQGSHLFLNKLQDNGQEH